MRERRAIQKHSLAVSFGIAERVNGSEPDQGEQGRRLMRDQLALGAASDTHKLADDIIQNSRSSGS
jgi:hypothetical protein